MWNKNVIVEMKVSKSMDIQHPYEDMLDSQGRRLLIFNGLLWNHWCFT